MKSQLKGGWTGKWNEIFNDLPAVVINEMQIWPCMWPSGRKWTKPGMNGPRKEDNFSIEKDCVSCQLLMPLLSGCFFSLKSGSLVQTGGRLMIISNAWCIPGRDKVGRAMGPLEEVWWLNRSFCNWRATFHLTQSGKLLFVTTLICESDPLQYLFYTVSFFESLLQTQRE